MTEAELPASTDLNLLTAPDESQGFFPEDCVFHPTVDNYIMIISFWYALNVSISRIGFQHDILFVRGR